MITTYIHCALEMVLDCVLLGYLISQASEAENIKT